ncbi:MAG: integrase arm-type DNA-binding domain-containing protein [Gloeomargarita sp. SKYG116]|nr:integrase arm-type DNA-binding domain-containing protein [Gloeomargarita sp. SKYG116]MCS7226744.1 integrase arm-type DNA-binding domain-containing protein [Gloeomargarita sp. SKYB31]MDW8401965.1 integrase arm-type DNA-binding domain-containing protein [Gloeomargarita sp. SKYGB_i_bin116]
MGRLTDVLVRQAQPQDKVQCLWDGGGLYLEITPTGAKGWRFKYSYRGRERRMSLGPYPVVSLREARKRRDEMRALLARGQDPLTVRKAQQANQTPFQQIAREWFEKQQGRWAAGHAQVVWRRLERDILPWLGERPIAAIESPELLAVLRKVEQRGAIETAHRELGICAQIWRYALATGRATRDITYDLQGALTPVRQRHFPAVTDPQRLGAILRLIWAYPGGPVVATALKLGPYLFVRPGELRQMKWSEIDWDAREWRFTLSKTHQPHVVPLANQVMDLLQELQPITGAGQYVFPSGRGGNRPMSDGAVLAALRTLGIPNDVMTGHSWRATARTLLDEVLGWRPDIIEHQLGHHVRDALGRAYNRTTFLPERHQMMQQWADYLDSLRLA